MEEKLGKVATKGMKSRESRPIKSVIKIWEGTQHIFSSPPIKGKLNESDE